MAVKATFWVAAEALEEIERILVKREVNNRIVETREVSPIAVPKVGEWKVYGDSSRIPKGAIRSGSYATRNVANQVARDLNVIREKKEAASGPKPLPVRQD